MDEDGQLPPYSTAAASAPWWLGRGVGLVLLLVVGAVVWTFSWNVATHVETQPPPVTPRWQGAEAAIAPVAGTARTARTGTGRTTEDEASEPATTDAPPPEAPTTEPPSTEAPSQSTDHALQAEELKRRQQERIEQAVRADEELAAFIESVGVLDQLEAWVTPISGEYRITATFGQAGSLWSNDHTGIDLAAPTGTPVASMAAGTVTHAGEAGAYGLQVEVIHSDGTETSYAHLSRIDVAEGQAVQPGTVLGAVGSTGNSTGPHLHLELRPPGGVPIDPARALLAYGVVL